MLSLYTFTEQLIEHGEPTVAHKVLPFDSVDEQATAQFLEQVYFQNAVHLPASPPPYNAEAAMWGVKYLYHSCQFALLRATKPEKIIEELAPWDKPVDASTIISVDLTLKHLPHLHHIIDRLAPGDVLLEQIKGCAAAWPMSSVGIKTEQVDQLNILLADPCLRMEYRDRIITQKAKDRLQEIEVVKLVQEALGGEHAALWPEVAELLYQEPKNDHE